MKSYLTTLFIALIVGYLGGVSSQFFQSRPVPSEHRPSQQIQAVHNPEFSSSLQVQAEPGDLSLQIAHLQQQINRLEIQLDEIAKNQSNNTDSTENNIINSTGKNTRQRRTVVPEKDNLISAGVDPDIADDILRRISQQEFRRLELQNLIQRNVASDIRQYRDELRELTKNKISLRSELGDDAYDQYLMASGKNNRMKVSSVMAESPAESSGMQKDDVILYYDDQRIFNFSDLREATLDGDIGSFTNIVVFRDGMRMSLIVSRGTLGVQLEGIQLDPAQER